ncbi:MAG TPA: hypothetical protein VHL08_07575 [Dongiaceae bacterium]|jgi:hypothetical protein|nr:hypothetical protein [Dongiaceae bacterium]
MISFGEYHALSGPSMKPGTVQGKGLFAVTKHAAAKYLPQGMFIK